MSDDVSASDDLLDATALDEISTLADVIAQASAHDGDLPPHVLDAALGVPARSDGRDDTAFGVAMAPAADQPAS